MTKEEAIKELIAMKPHIEYGMSVVGADAYDMAIEALKAQLSEEDTTFGMWIPVSERLPEEKEKAYWVCLNNGYQCQCRWTNNPFGLGANDYWSEWTWHIKDRPPYTKVVAWMPLPEHYTEEQS